LTAQPLFHINKLYPVLCAQGSPHAVAVLYPYQYQYTFAGMCFGRLQRYIYNVLRPAPVTVHIYRAYKLVFQRTFARQRFIRTLPVHISRCLPYYFQYARNLTKRPSWYCTPARVQRLRN